MKLLKRNLPIIVLSSLIFMLSFFIGFLQHYNPGEYVLENCVICKYKSLEDISLPEILINNIKVILYLVLGGFTAGFLTLHNLIVNGFLVGSSLKFLVCRDLPYHVIILLTLPHGVFEIAAVIFAGAAGFKIPFEVVRYLLGRKNKVLTKEDLKEFLILSLVAIVLIIIAAWIEAYVTSDIAKSMIEKGQLG